MKEFLGHCSELSSVSGQKTHNRVYKAHGPGPCRRDLFPLQLTSWPRYPNTLLPSPSSSSPFQLLIYRVSVHLSRSHRAAYQPVLGEAREALDRVYTDSSRYGLLT